MARPLALVLLAVAVIDFSSAAFTFDRSGKFVKTNDAGACPTGWSLITSEAKCKQAGKSSATAAGSKTCTYGDAATSTNSNFRASTNFGARPQGCWQSGDADGCVYWNPSTDDAVATFGTGRSICEESSQCTPYGCSHRVEYSDRSADFVPQIASFSMKDVTTVTNANPQWQVINGALYSSAESFINEAKTGDPNRQRQTGQITSMTTPAANTNTGGYEFVTNGINAAGEACAMAVRVGIQMCITCNEEDGWSRRGGGSSGCPLGVAMVGLEIENVQEADSTADCSRWFLYADAHVRTIATAWRANWIYDRLPPAGSQYVHAHTAACGSTGSGSHGKPWLCCDQ